MIQLVVLNPARNPSRVFVAKRLPVTVGRGSGCDFRVEEDGVWDRHLVIRVVDRDGIGLKAIPGAFTAVRGEPVQEAPLRNGDVIEMGGVQMRFGLRPVGQHGLSFREALTWAALIAVCLSQIVLVYTFLVNA